MTPPPVPFDLVLPGAADTRQAALEWLSGLAKERRLSPRTVEAYGRDLRQFLSFLTMHLGEPPSVAAILALKPLDIRAFLAARRGAGVQGRSLMRQLAALRSFARHLERDGHGTASAFAAIRSPKVSKTLPRPLSPASAVAVTETGTRAGDNRKPWILARDAAVLALLYGAGLRISEALGIRRRDAPVAGVDAVTVTGKGRKVRSVPVIATVQQAVEAYLDLCPYALMPEGPLFVGARGGDLRGIQELLGHASLSTTQMYTKVDATRLMEAFDAAHPRAGKAGQTQTEYADFSQPRK